MSLTTFGLGLYLLPISLTFASYLGYPLLLLVLRRRRVPVPITDPPEWPLITIVLPVFNEARVIAATLDNVLAADYPPERRHVLVVSDASFDGTDEIVRGFADRNVELVHLAKRGGKTAAENVAADHLRGSIVINLDATIRISPSSLKALVRAFEDPSIGVVSGRDISVGDKASDQNLGESRYVGYEMWVRRLET